MFNQKTKVLVFSSFLCSSMFAANLSNAQTPEFTKQMEAYLNSDAGIEKIMTAMSKYAQKKQQQDEEEKNKDAIANYKKYFSIGNSPVKGNKNAKVTVVEVSDFECPYCSRGKAVIDEVLKAYPKEVKVVFKNLPLSFHQNAKPAALAALAAGEQKKFWEMHNLIFDNQRELSREKYLEFAKQLKLDLKKFEKDMDGEKLAKQLDNDIEMAGKLGVQGTPGFFINGTPIRGALPFEAFKSIIDKELAKGKK
ncbi:MAG: thioredoxin domain-containing protein [Deltaproteobacteria bacterium]|jgi:protein-disulfide isomerase|nr:thioredoxin domain-containing protein [Deltaproteobacteria bacterium]